MWRPQLLSQGPRKFHSNNYLANVQQVSGGGTEDRGTNGQGKLDAKAKITVISEKWERGA